jgi:glycosyltransferase involved in cell wall biosynthesis
MGNEDKLYGRRRIKKQRPIITPRKADAAPAGKAVSSSEKDKALSNEIPSVGKSMRLDKVVEPKREHTPMPGRDSSARRKPSKSHPRRDYERDKTSPRVKEARSQRKPYSKPRIRVSVVIPAYDEQENVRPLMEQFDEVIKRSGKDWEVVFVNDGSTDNTAETARNASNRYHWLRVISYARNRGLTAALDTGFKAARGSIFVFYPADMQYHPQDIPRMIAKIDRGADLVTGWKQGKYRKRFVSYAYNRLCRVLFGLKVHDLNSVKAFRKEVVDSLSLRRDWHRYMVVIAAEAGFVIDESKVTLYPRKYGRSKFGTARILGGLLDLFSVKFQIAFMKRPLRFFGTWGFIFGIAGFIIGLIAVYLRFFTIHGSRTLLYLVILLTLSGLMLFAIGFLAEVMVGLRDEIESLKSKR